MIPALTAVARPRAAAVIAYRASASVAANSTTFAVAIPATAKAGDVALLFFHYNYITAAISTGPNLFSSTVGTPQQDATEIESRVWWRKLQGGDPGTTITITVGATMKGTLSIGVWSGVDGVNPAPAAAQASETGTTDGHVTPTVTDTIAGGWIVSFVGDKNATATALWTAPSSAVTRKTAFTTGAGALTSVIGDSGGPVTGLGSTQGGLVWDSDQSTAKATMRTLLLQPGRSVSNPNGGKIVPGGYNNCVTTGSDGWTGSAYPGDTSAHFAEIRNAYLDPGLWNVRRSFTGSIVANISATSASTDAANGITPCLSVKGDPAGVVAGTYDANIATLAASMPAGSYLIYQHEPENDMPASTFVPAFQHFYTAAKAANANLLIGPSHMAYQWSLSHGAPRPSTPTPSDWYVGDSYCDFVACDAYIMDWQATVTAGIGSSVDSGFPRWHAFFATTGKPLVLTELGIQVNGTADPAHLGQHTDPDRVTMLGASLDYLKAQGYAMILYWNGYKSDAGVRDFNITPTVSASGGHPTVLSVWNSKMALYGATTTDIRNVA